MRFRVEHEFPAPPPAVIALMLDPEFATSFRLPDLGPAEVLESERGAGDAEGLLRLRYEYTGSLDPIAQRLLGARKLALVQEVRMSRSTATGRLSITAEADPTKLRGTGPITFLPHDGGCTRVLDGDLVVKMPLMGGAVERRLVPGVRARLDGEAAALLRRLPT